MATKGLRLDRWLVAQGYAESRQRAQWLIESGRVWMDGQPCRKPSLLVPEAADVDITGSGLPYVSRGGVKLAQALRNFGLDVAGAVALDIGASTGGFTDCLLQRGARRVYALDVGTDQLAARLRTDARVIVMEGRNIRHVQAQDFPEAVDLITIDVSFISLTLVLPLLPPFLPYGGHVVALVKPQFEVGAAQLGRGGIVRDTGHRELALQRVMSVAETSGFQVLQATNAPASHAFANREIFVDLGWALEHSTTVWLARGAPHQPLPGPDAGERGGHAAGTQ